MELTDSTLLPFEVLTKHGPCVTMLEQLKADTFTAVESVMKLFGMALLLVAACGVASASAVPEIDPGSAGSALALLTGALLVIRGRSKK
jgi:hypothetical protein